MDTSNAKWYIELAQSVLADDFRIEDNLGEKMRGLSTLLCEMERTSPHGIGGQSFRHWVAGVFRDGVYVYADNHRVGVRFTTDPKAMLRRGCQESRDHGDPWPHPCTGEWGHLSCMPETVVSKVYRIANEILRDATEAVIAKATRLLDENDAAWKKEREKQEAIAAAWS
jgi:hypothetical protein